MRTWLLLLVGGSVLLLSGCIGGADATRGSTGAPAASRTVAVVVEDGAVVEDPGPVTVTFGTEVVLEVTADISDLVHVHGYDVSALTRPDRTTTVEFRADIPGEFDIELEEQRLSLLELRVR